MAKITVIQQIRNDFAADDIRHEGFYLYAGPRVRTYVNIDGDEVRTTRASSNRGRNYVLFLALHLYRRFRLIPARGSLCAELITSVEIARAQHFHRRMARMGHGLGYLEHWDGTRWRIIAVPYVEMDRIIPLALPVPS